jgi:hypothetical protein
MLRAGGNLYLFLDCVTEVVIKKNECLLFISRVEMVIQLAYLFCVLVTENHRLHVLYQVLITVDNEAGIYWEKWKQK